MSIGSVELKQKHFSKISQIVYQKSGIHLKKGKEALVRARLTKRLRVLKIANIDAYMEYLESEAGTREMAMMIDAMTTNKTSFFREQQHFDFLRDEVLPNLDPQRLRFWCAACSSGEEPLSLAILLSEEIDDVQKKDIKILATDISMRVLEKAHHGIYPKQALEDMPRAVLLRYFTKIQNNNGGAYQIRPDIQKMVKLAYLNLMEKWPMKGPFNVIFCRNVMIYFDRKTQQKLINRFYDLVEPGGYLFVGHSEGLSAVNHDFRYIRPATYQK